MPKTLIKSRFFPNKHKPIIKFELNITKSNLPPNLQKCKQKLISENGFFTI